MALTIFGGGGDGGEFFGGKGRAADEEAGVAGLLQVGGGVFEVDRSAVKKRDFFVGDVDDELTHHFGFFGAARLSGADRPHRLIGDHYRRGIQINVF